MALCLSGVILALTFTQTSSSQTARNYDPWLDINDDGIIDIYDVVSVCIAYDSKGTPINKTQLLLEILAKIDNLNATLQDLEAYVETRMPKKGKIIISPIEFQPYSNTQSYLKTQYILYGDPAFRAVIQLPHKAIVTKVTALVYDDRADGYVSLSLTGYNITSGNYLNMAYMQTEQAGTPYGIILYDDTIENAIINNQNCFYYLTLYFSYNTNHLYFCWATIEYEYPS